MLPYFKELEEAVLNEDFYSTYEITEKIKQQDNASEYITPMLKLMEDNPMTDFGMPGYLVHFMEPFPEYEQLLLDSVKRIPTEQTVVMLNRIINGSSGSDRQKYIDILKEIMNRNDIENCLQQTIKEFLEYQASKEG